MLLISPLANLKQAVKKTNAYLDEKFLYDNAGHVISSELSPRQVCRLAKYLWSLGLTDGVENDVDAWRKATPDSVTSDMDTVTDEVKAGTFNGSFNDL